MILRPLLSVTEEVARALPAALELEETLTDELEAEDEELDDLATDRPLPLLAMVLTSRPFASRCTIAHSAGIVTRWAGAVVAITTPAAALSVKSFLDTGLLRRLMMARGPFGTACIGSA